MSEASEIILASSPAGNAVMHVYAEGRVIETQTGQKEQLVEYAETRFPDITIKEVTN